VVVGLCEINIALTRFIQRRLSFTVVYSVAAFRVKLGANDLKLCCCAVKPYLLTLVVAVACVMTEMLAKFTEVEKLDGQIYACDQCNSKLSLRAAVHLTCKI